MVRSLHFGAQSALLLLFLLLASLESLAAGDAPLTSQAPSLTARPLTLERDERTSLPLEQPSTESRPGKAPFGLRLLMEVAGGTVMAVSGGLVMGLGSLGQCAIAAASPLRSEDNCMLTPLLTVLGMFVGYPLGVWGGGEAMGGDGRLLGTFLGGAVGLVPMLLMMSNQHWSSLGIVTPVITWVVGCSVGYELSRLPGRTERAKQTATFPRLQPILAIDSHRGMIGLGGQF
ncbi:hypothetical protein F0U62_23505 [Cystobacter fuscus]|uniref:hypothetical protein n=1 Tax=Cystobacter fuscus TaxID=43 RepID=UPI002B2DD763|nr:hypothetical protein F0U62_23505 [Cystobacter fuscus]